MKSLSIRALASASLGVLAVIVMIGASAPARSTAPLQPDKVVLVTTSDVKGKTSPCG